MSDPAEYPRGPRTTPTRLRERVVYDMDAVHAVLDEGLVCHVGVVVDGQPLVLPTIHARVGRRLYLHSSTGSRLAGLARDEQHGGGVPVCVTVTLVDGLVLARSQFNHSMNYRSVVVRGRAELVTHEAEREAALTAVVEHVVPGAAPAAGLRTRGSWPRPPSCGSSCARRPSNAGPGRPRTTTRTSACRIGRV